MPSYLGWYVLTNGYALQPSPAYIAWCFGTGMFRATAEAMAQRPLFSGEATP